MLRLRNARSYEGGVVVGSRPLTPQEPRRVRLLRALLTLSILTLLIAGAWVLIDLLFGYYPVAIAVQPNVQAGFTLPGRVQDVLVNEGETIAPGQPLARLATAELDARLAEAEAALARAEARLVEEREILRLRQAELHNQHEDKLLRLLVEEEELSSDAVKDQARLARLREQVGGYKLELERLRKLKADGVATDRQLDQARTAYDSHAAELAELEVAVKQVRQRHANAVQRREAWTGRRVELNIEPLLAPWEKAVREAAAVVQRLQAERAAAVLTSPGAGIIVERLLWPGSVLRPGEPVLRLALEGPLVLQAYVEEPYMNDFPAGAAVVLVSNADGRERSSTVLAVSPEVTQIPVEHQPFYTGSVRFGRKITLALPNQPILPGATFRVAAAEGRLSRWLSRP